MNCSRCGGNMEKGVLRYLTTGYGFGLNPLEWFNNKKFEKYGKFPKSLFLYPDLKIYGTIREFRCGDFEAYRCENCGAILIIPPEDDTEQNKDR